MQLSHFFDLLYELKPDDSYLLLWQPNKDANRSTWFKDTDEAAAFVEACGQDDIYFQVGLAGKEYARNQRCHLDEKVNRPVIAIPGGFADIDITHPCHKKKDLPATVEEALSIVKGHGFDPTITIHSGHGLQCYWLFKEMWELDTPEERKKAMVFLRRLKLALQRQAALKGYKIDSVQDLTRILRPPESWNCKDKNNPVQVRIIEEGGRRYNPEDLEELLPEDPGDEKPSPSSVATVDTRSIHSTANTLILNEYANPPADKFTKLADLFGDRFWGSWKNTRKDISDTSPSGYDFSLAMFAAQAGWSPQEIADLMIAHRRNNGHDLKLNNRQYYSRSVLAARDSIAGEKLDEFQTGKRLDISQKITESDTDPPKEKMRKMISLKLGIEVMVIEKYVEDDPYYIIKTADRGDIDVGNVDNLMKQDRLRSRVAAQTNHYVPKMKSKEWDTIIPAIMDILKEVKVSEESTPAGRIKVWLQEYLEKETEATIEEAEYTRSPFVKDGHWHIFLNTFFSWAKNVCNMGFTIIISPSSDHRIDAVNNLLQFQRNSPPC